MARFETSTSFQGSPVSGRKTLRRWLLVSGLAVTCVVLAVVTIVTLMYKAPVPFDKPMAPTTMLLEPLIVSAKNAGIELEESFRILVQIEPATSVDGPPTINGLPARHFLLCPESEVVAGGTSDLLLEILVPADTQLGKKVTVGFAGREYVCTRPSWVEDLHVRYSNRWRWVNVFQLRRLEVENSADVLVVDYKASVEPFGKSYVHGTVVAYPSAGGKLLVARRA